MQVTEIYDKICLNSQLHGMISLKQAQHTILYGHLKGF